tara:strand:+ start:63 stop:1376 length:1314 start_codon:yes stop_codon:yes gene_type:complete
MRYFLIILSLLFWGCENTNSSDGICSDPTISNYYCDSLFDTWDIIDIIFCPTNGCVSDECISYTDFGTLSGEYIFNDDKTYSSEFVLIGNDDEFLGLSEFGNYYINSESMLCLDSYNATIDDSTSNCYDIAFNHSDYNQISLQTYNDNDDCIKFDLERRVIDHSQVSYQFPLSIGNSWLYDYEYEYQDMFLENTRDTIKISGTMLMEVVDYKDYFYTSDVYEIKLSLNVLNSDLEENSSFEQYIYLSQDEYGLYFHGHSIVNESFLDDTNLLPRGFSENAISILNPLLFNDYSQTINNSNPECDNTFNYYNPSRKILINPIYEDQAWIYASENQNNIQICEDTGVEENYPNLFFAVKNYQNINEEYFEVVTNGSVPSLSPDITHNYTKQYDSNGLRISSQFSELGEQIATDEFGNEVITLRPKIITLLNLVEYNIQN